GLLDFILERDALVEVWAYGEGLSALPRRLSAPELANRKRERWEGPTFVTITYRDSTAGELVRYRVEFGFSAAENALAATQSYRHQREIQLLARQILGARDNHGRLSALSQWEALVNAAQEGRFPLTEVPSRPAAARDLFVAFEFEV